MPDFRLDNPPPADGFGADFDAAFDAADTKERYTIPNGSYCAKIVRGSLGRSKNGSPFFEIQFQLDDPEQPPETVSKKLYLTERALPYSKATLIGLGLDTSAKLKQPFPPPGAEWIAQIEVLARQTETGRFFNEVDSFYMISRRPAPANPFAAPAPSGPPAPVNPAAPSATPTKRS